MRLSERELLLTNARIVLETETVLGTLRISDGIIADIDQSSTQLPSAIDFEGDYLLPGLIDVHTDHLEKHAMPRSGMFWDPVNAAMTHDLILCAGGTTTVFDSLMVGSLGNSHRRELLPFMIGGLRKAREQGLLRIEHFLHLRCDAREADMLDLFTPYLGDPLLRFVTIMDNSPSRDAERYERASRRKGVAEEKIQRELAEASSRKERNQENRRRLVQICRDYSLPLASHDDTLAEHIAEAAGFGLTISEFPISQEAALAAHEASMTIIAGSPNIVAGRSHIGNVSVGELVSRGIVDIICSDYIPASLLHAIWLVTRDPIGLTLPQAVAMATTRPADIFGLTDRGEIARGRRADLIRVREQENSPVVRNVWVQGRRAL